MTDEAPKLSPIADHFKALQAEQEDQARLEAQRQAEIQRADDEARQREADRRQLRAIKKKTGESEAYRFGRALGYGNDDIAEMLAPRPKPKPDAAPAPAADGGGDRDGGGDDAAPAGEGSPHFKPKERPIKPLPADCPIVPLGKLNGRYFYLDPLGQLRELAGKDHNAMGLRDLAGTRVEYLWRLWPKYREDGTQTGWKADEAAESLMTAASNKGVFNPLTRIRGVGGWADARGNLVLHAGDGVLIDGEWKPPGQYEGLLYPADDAMVRPAESGEATRLAIEKLLKRLDQWNWQNDIGEGGKPLDLDGSGHRLPSLVLLGWLAAARAGAALRLRPIVWLTGDAGTGKTTLMDLLSIVLGGGLVKATNATEAGVSTVIGHSTKAVLLDESENEAQGQQMGKLIKLARESATGGNKLRGSSDHKGHEFNARSAFIFSSIIIPPLQPADRSRMSILELGALPAGAAFSLDEAEWKLVGQALVRRLIDGWPRWPEVFARYRDALLKRGMQAQRGLERFATLLGMAELMRFDGEPDSDTVEALAAAFSTVDAEEGTDCEAMLHHLLSIPLDVFRGGERQTVGALVARASGLDRENPHSIESCRDALKAWSIFVDGCEDLTGTTATVVLPNTGEGLRRLFDNTKWRGEAGVSGGWSQGMKRIKGAVDVNSRRFGGRGYRVPARAFLMMEEGD